MKAQVGIQGNTDIQQAFGVQNCGVILKLLIHEDTDINDESIQALQFRITWSDILNGTTNGIQIWTHFQKLRNPKPTFVNYRKSSNSFISNLIVRLGQELEAYEDDVDKEDDISICSDGSINSLMSNSITPTFDEDDIGGMEDSSLSSDMSLEDRTVILSNKKGIHKFTSATVLKIQIF